MATERQVLANRRNAQKSTGPRTQQGKSVISQNAIRHGLSAAQTVISDENPLDFALHRDQLLAELAPLSPLESTLAERIVTLSWRLKRASRLQTRTINALNAKHTTGPLSKLTQSILPNQGLNEDPPPQPDLQLSRTIIKDFSNARVLDRLLMYERRIENSLYKTILEIQRLNLIRNMTPTNPHD